MNSIAVPRMPGEAMGAICRLQDMTDSTKEIVINVEYNQLDALLKAKWNPKGDVPNEKGYSSFPGNINTLVFKLPEYVANLEKSKGVIPEFVNPKYADEARNKFKAPTRLECMMQDYPRLLSSKGAVGFTTYDTWYSFSPVKNNIKDAAGLFAKGMPPCSASSGEYDFFSWTNQILEKIAGVKIEKDTELVDYSGIKLAFGPKILLDPTFAITLQELREKFKGENKVSKGSTLILKGYKARAENLELDGFLETKDGEVSTGKVQNKDSIHFDKVEEGQDEVYRIRGYFPCKH
jgi:UDP-sugar pyrophosphorylase